MIGWHLVISAILTSAAVAGCITYLLRPPIASAEIDQPPRLRVGRRQDNRAELRAIGHVPDDEVLVLERDGEDSRSSARRRARSRPRRHRAPAHREAAHHGVLRERAPRNSSRHLHHRAAEDASSACRTATCSKSSTRRASSRRSSPAAKLRVKDGMKFFEQVPCGGSS